MTNWKSKYTNCSVPEEPYTDDKATTNAKDHNSTAKQQQSQKRTNNSGGSDGNEVCVVSFNTDVCAVSYML
jgi:hypothetical protein